MTAPASRLPGARGRPSAGRRRAGGPPAGLWFWTIVVFFFLEYARPPLIVSLKLQMLIVLALLYGWATATEKRWHPIVVAQLLFVALCAFHVPFAWNNYSAYFITRTMLGNVAVALGISWAFARRDRFAWGMWSWVVVMAYVALFGVTHGGFGPGGFLGDENDLALAVVTALPFGFFGFEQLRGWKRWLSATFAVLAVIAVIVSFSRGGFVALAGVALFCWLTSRRKVRNLGVLAFGTLAFLLLAPQSYIDEVKTVRDTSSGTAETRRFLWETATNMWLDHPLIGVGGGNFNYLAGRYQPTDYEGREFQERSWAGTTVHSAYFQLLSEQGIAGIGLVGFIGVAHFGLIRRLRKDVRRARRLPAGLRRDAELYGASLSAAMIGYLIAAAFLSVAYYPFFWYFSALAVAFDSSMRREMARSLARSGRERAEGKRSGLADARPEATTVPARSGGTRPGFARLLRGGRSAGAAGGPRGDRRARDP